MSVIVEWLQNHKEVLVVGRKGVSFSTAHPLDEWAWLITITANSL
ncbi:hypothetical protein P4H26_17885 [Paenibacillus larvae]|nr:hypothetical protein [Paenibacillus larvae]MEC0088074.1 hypothetical protein [Paenibacillus larvae]